MDYFADGSVAKNHSRTNHHYTGSKSRYSLCSKQREHTDKMAIGTADHVSILMTLFHKTSLHFLDLCTNKMGQF
jgi:hypothetical protein